MLKISWSVGFEAVTVASWLVEQKEENVSFVHRVWILETQRQETDLVDDGKRLLITPLRWLVMVEEIVHITAKRDDVLFVGDLFFQHVPLPAIGAHECYSTPTFDPL